MSSPDSPEFSQFDLENMSAAERRRARFPAKEPKKKKLKLKIVDSPEETVGEEILFSPTNVPKKQISTAIRWCFTWNNYTEKDIVLLVPIINSLCKVAIVSKEVGESGTKHLQGYVEFKKRCRPVGLFDKATHWEKAKGTKAQNVIYCSKEENIIIYIGFPPKVKTIPTDDLYYWQKDIVKIVEKEPDDRTIYWYHGDGNIGKTSFCKYLTIHHDAICIGGKLDDIKNGIMEYQLANDGFLPKLILFNIPKSQYHISYAGMEIAKDMYFYSGKYKGGMVCGNPPHIFVFSNDLPDLEMMSKDRWNIHKILSPSS